VHDRADAFHNFGVIRGDCIGIVLLSSAIVGRFDHHRPFPAASLRALRKIDSLTRRITGLTGPL
jgi:hypothetical protein